MRKSSDARSLLRGILPLLASIGTLPCLRTLPVSMAAESFREQELGHFPPTLNRGLDTLHVIVWIASIQRLIQGYWHDLDRGGHNVSDETITASYSFVLPLIWIEQCASQKTTVVEAPTWLPCAVILLTASSNILAMSSCNFFGFVL